MNRTMLWAALAGLGASLYLFATVDNSSTVAEDAAILMRYSQHLAEGHGYAWNPGEPPVDGATDWLGATLLGGLYAAGIPLEAGPRLLGGTAHALTVALVVIVAASGLHAPLAVAVVSAAFVAVGAPRAYVEAGFLTPLFAFGALAGWACIVFGAEQGKASGRHIGLWQWPVLFALAMLFTTLTRPEGVAFTCIMLAASAFVLDRGRFGRFVAATAVVFGTLFVAFVLWRWQYFGRLLPLPFLKKGGGTLHWDGFYVSARGVVILLGWLLPALAFGFRRGRPLQWLAALCVVIGGYAAMWIALSSEMDYYFRFQYALVPIVMASWPAVWADAWPELHQAARQWPPPVKRALTALTIVAVAGALVWQHRRFQTVSTEHGLKNAAMLLREFGSTDNVVVTTEAGLIPLYSRWKAIDAWGLNDARIVYEGGITTAYLEDADPDVIVFHAYYTPLVKPEHSDRNWTRMVTTLHQFATCRDYSLAGIFAAGFAEAHYFFVKPEWEGAAAFTKALRAQPYRWWGLTQPVPDLSALEPQQATCN
jgi:hypothetical protein